MATKQPADKSYFILPDLGEGVHEAELIRWRVKPGEKVDEHQTLAEMETDKALVEVPSPWAGVVSELHGKEGEILKVGEKLVSYESAAKAQGEKPKRVRAESVEQARPPLEESEREDAGTVVGSVGGELTISERFARRREAGNGRTTAGKVLATPAVRRIAREMGVDINRVEGTGRGGRVTAADIEAFAGGDVAMRPARRPDAPRPSVSVSADGVAERIPIRGVRRTIAQALDLSVRTAVHFTVVDEADATLLDRKRLEYSRVIGRKLSMLPFILAAVCKGLRAHPPLNANVDDANEEILLKGVINLGIAVDTDHGLMVPVLHDADRLSIAQMSEKVAELAKQCRERTIPREQLTGGTFTISNVGAYGGMFATPIINYPEVAILGTGRAYEKVLTKDGMFYAGKALPLSLSCDHRVVDGAEGARFLNTVRTLLEQPEELIEG
jgi:pyruvate dehydrogenase E2 component (dihydrolipoamide acetyltransferase)